MADRADASAGGARDVQRTTHRKCKGSKGQKGAPGRLEPWRTGQTPARGARGVQMLTQRRCKAVTCSCARARECETAADWADAGAADRRDNSELLDNNSANQRLTKADIDAMRAAGAAGATIVEAMVANSATFADKTQFSQARTPAAHGRLSPCC